MPFPVRIIFEGTGTYPDFIELQFCPKEKMDITTGLLNVFANDINQKAANTKLLINGTPVYTIEMLKFLIHANALYTGSNFLPETNDDILNKALFAVGTKFNQLVRKNRFLILIIGYVCRI